MFSTVILGVGVRRRVLEAAYNVYFEFWGKEFDQILERVPSASGVDTNFKHLTKKTGHVSGTGNNAPISLNNLVSRYSMVVLSMDSIFQTEHGH